MTAVVFMPWVGRMWYLDFHDKKSQNSNEKPLLLPVINIKILHQLNKIP